MNVFFIFTCLGESQRRSFSRNFDFANFNFMIFSPQRFGSRNDLAIPLQSRIFVRVFHLLAAAGKTPRRMCDLCRCLELAFRKIIEPAFKLSLERFISQSKTYPWAWRSDWSFLYTMKTGNFIQILQVGATKNNEKENFIQFVWSDKRREIGERRFALSGASSVCDFPVYCLIFYKFFPLLNPFNLYEWEGAVRKLSSTYGHLFTVCEHPGPLKYKDIRSGIWAKLCRCAFDQWRIVWAFQAKKYTFYNNTRPRSLIQVQCLGQGGCSAGVNNNVTNVFLF